MCTTVMFTAVDGFDIVGNCSTQTLENICKDTTVVLLILIVFIIGYILLHCVNNVSIPSIVFDENDVKRAM